MSAEAGTAGRCGNYHSGFNEGLQQTAAQSVEIDLLCCGDNDSAYALCNMLALYYLCGSLQVGVPAVGT